MTLGHFHERGDESPRKDENFGASGSPVPFFVSEIWPFEVEILQCKIWAMLKGHNLVDKIYRLAALARHSIIGR